MLAPFPPNSSAEPLTFSVTGGDGSLGVLG